jgi:hypothetical protein
MHEFTKINMYEIATIIQNGRMDSTKNSSYIISKW